MTQDEVLGILKTGAHVFLTGEAGSGKTHTINRYTEYLSEHEIDFAVTASTGIAATHIHGMTIHSWSGIGVETALDDDALKHLAENRYVAKRIKKAKVLIIDEISMLDGAVLTLVERVCRKVRKLRLPFGGLQVVLVGDFFQLPPVGKQGRAVEFAFDSEVWQVLQPVTCYLTEQHRQADSVFLNILSAIRRNEFDETHFESISGRIIAPADLPDDMTRLYSHNANVDTLNTAELKKLPGKSHTFVMALRGSEALTDTLVRGCLSPQRLELKVGATVMFTKNNANQGFVNGTLGTVVGFDSESKYPIVETREGERIETEPMEWMISEGETVLAKITQLPLRLAWALTIHKSQGVSLDAAVMDLSQTFEYGQGYVALSRVRTLLGVHLIGINARALEVHPAVLEKDQTFRAASLRAEGELAAREEEQQRMLEKNFITLCGGTLGTLARTSRGLMRKKKSSLSPPLLEPASPRRERGEKEGAEGGSQSHSYEKIRAIHPQAYRAWSKDEEVKLQKLYHKGIQIREMAEILGRQPGGIRSRLKKLGLTEG
ncbi:MAG: PIF1 family DEAD/DEAH box helicase [bacterium]|nr:PIF1 family DEAD/DEAH box helicase [bacterium]